MKKRLLLNVILVMCACGGLDTLECLGGNYVFVGEGFGLNRIDKIDEQKNILKSVYSVASYDYDETHIIVKTMTNVESQKKFVREKLELLSQEIVHQKKLDSIQKKYYALFSQDDSFYFNIYNKIKKGTSIGEEILKVLRDSNYSNSEDVSQFYIVLKKQDSIYGNFNFQDFVQKRRDLKVSEKLTFKYF